MMTTNETDSRRRPRHAMFQSMALAIDLWLRADDLDDSGEQRESVTGAASARS
jgi:hypothetical protein